MHYKVRIYKAKSGKPNPNFIPPPSVSQSASYDRALALQCAELISQLMHDHEDDLVHFYQEVLRELGCDVRVERTKIPEFTGSAFHMVPAVKHTITNKEGYHKEITYL